MTSDYMYDDEICLIVFSRILRKRNSFVCQKGPNTLKWLSVILVSLAVSLNTLKCGIFVEPRTPVDWSPIGESTGAWTARCI